MTSDTAASSIIDTNAGSNGLSDDAVAAYLSANPGFFDRFPQLLELIVVPHDSGSAVSLVERQLTGLRETNAALRAQLDDLLSAARANDTLFEKTAAFSLELWSADSWQGISDTIGNRLKDAFSADAARLIVFSDAAPSEFDNLRNATMEQQDRLGELAEVRCAPVRPGELQTLFELTADRPGSAALVPVIGDQVSGVLAIGSREPNRFDASQGTVFLDFIGASLAGALDRLGERSAS